MVFIFFGARLVIILVKSVFSNLNVCPSKLERFGINLIEGLLSIVLTQGIINYSRKFFGSSIEIKEMLH